MLSGASRSGMPSPVIPASSASLKKISSSGRPSRFATSRAIAVAVHQRALAAQVLDRFAEIGDELIDERHVRLRHADVQVGRPAAAGELGKQGQPRAVISSSSSKMLISSDPSVNMHMSGSASTRMPSIFAMPSSMLARRRPGLAHDALVTHLAEMAHHRPRGRRSARSTCCSATVGLITAYSVVAAADEQRVAAQFAVAVQHHRRVLRRIAVLVHVGGDAGDAVDGEIEIAHRLAEPPQERQVDAADAAVDVKQDRRARCATAAISAMGSMVPCEKFGAEPTPSMVLGPSAARKASTSARNPSAGSTGVTTALQPEVVRRLVEGGMRGDRQHDLGFDRLRAVDAGESRAVLTASMMLSVPPLVMLPTTWSSPRSSSATDPTTSFSMRAALGYMLM